MTGLQGAAGAFCEVTLTTMLITCLVSNSSSSSSCLISSQAILYQPALTHTARQMIVMGHQTVIRRIDFIRYRCRMLALGISLDRIDWPIIGLIIYASIICIKIVALCWRV